MWKKAAIILALLVVVYTAAGFLALPLFLKSFAQEQLAGVLKRQVAIRDIDINPFVLSIRVEGLAVSEGRDQALVASFDEFFVNLQIRSLFKKALIAREVKLVRPSLIITRTGPNRYNFSDLLEGTGSAGKPLSFLLGNIRLTDGSLEVRDRVTDTLHRTTGITMNIPFLSNIDDLVETFVQPSFSAVVNGTAFSLTGQTKPFADSLETSFDIDLKGISLPFYMGYLPRDLKLTVRSGTLDIKGKISYIQYRGRRPDIVALGDAALKDLVVLDTEGRPLAALPDIRVTLAPSLLAEKTVVLSEVQVNSPKVCVRRESSGDINWLTLFARDSVGKSDESTQAGINLDMKSFSLNRGTVEFTDAFNQSPVKLVWSEMDLKARDISTRERAQGSIRFSSRLNGTGSVSSSAGVALNPLVCEAQVDVGGLEIGWVQPYFADKIHLVVTRGHLSTEGRVRVEKRQNDQPAVSFDGGVRMGDFASVDKKHRNDFIKWRTLVLDDIHAATNPGILDIGGVHIEDFSSQILIHEDGSLNLDNIFQNEKETGGDIPEGAGQQALERIRIAKTVLENGEVSFLDKSVKPNFSLDLGEIWGSLTGLSSEKTEHAAVDLSAKLNYSAPLKVTGRINPLADPLFLDLNTRLQGMDMSAMTPYSGKYLGHAIEKGKLFLDTRSHMDNQELDVQNELLLDQLTFGGPVGNTDVVGLPVKFAAALLKDSKGRIELRLPVKGRVDDPEFSFLHVIAKTIMNTITKAAVSPFSLLEALYPGASELGPIEFDPGRADLPAGCTDKIELLVQILTDKPSLRLDIQGFADVEKDRAGLADVMFQNKLKAEKLRSLAKYGAKVRNLEEIVIDPGEYEIYLGKAYDASDFPKPRNFIGLPLSLKPVEMEKLIREHIRVTDNDLKALALNRAQKVKDCIVDMQSLDPSRISLIEKDALSPEEKQGVRKSRAEIMLK